MMCDRARRLFGACWDDELTQAEREWLEAHFASCDGCRAEYDDFSRALELTGALPRVEPAPELAERVLARVRRTAAEPDRVGERSVRWAPAAAMAASAAVVLAVGVITIAPHVAWRAPGGGEHQVAIREVRPAPILPGLSSTNVSKASVAVRMPARRGIEPARTAVIPDSLFDHGEDVEFILDPVTLHRGRAMVTRPGSVTPGVQGQQAIITF
jgi:predicted anti-sigma-YlaC factor YlaD